MARKARLSRSKRASKPWIPLDIHFTTLKLTWKHMMHLNFTIGFDLYSATLLKNIHPHTSPYSGNHIRQVPTESAETTPRIQDFSIILCLIYQWCNDVLLFRPSLFFWRVQDTRASPLGGSPALERRMSKTTGTHPLLSCPVGS